MAQERESMRERLSPSPSGLPWPAMDALVGLLDGPRARGAFVLRVAMAPPWAVRVQDEAPLSIVAMARGEA